MKKNILAAAFAATMMLTALTAGAQTAWSDVFNKFKMEVRADGEYTTTDTTPIFRVTRIEDIVLKLNAKKEEADRQALKRAEEIRKSGTRSLTLEDLEALKRAAEINAEAKAQAEAKAAAAKAKEEAEAAKAKAAAAKAKAKAERNQRVQARKAEKAKALAGGGIDFANIFGI
jgi:colicin import membrane protein